jgi:hypothetical protein
MMTVYKLFHVRKDGSIGSLFINRSVRLPVGKWLAAEDHPTKGYAFRPGWHCTFKPDAPHLSTRGRRWFRVEIKGYTIHLRPLSQGGLWYTANQMRIIGPVS